MRAECLYCCCDKLAERKNALLYLEKQKEDGAEVSAGAWKADAEKGVLGSASLNQSS